MRASYYQKIALQKISDYNHNLKLQQLNKRVYSPIREEQELQYQQQNMFLDTIQIVSTQLHYQRPRRNYIKPTDLNKNYTMMWLKSKGVENQAPAPIRKEESAYSGRRSPLMLTLDKFNELFVSQNERALAKAEQLLQKTLQEEQYHRTDFASLCERATNQESPNDIQRLQNMLSIKQANQLKPELDIQLDGPEAKNNEKDEVVKQQEEQAPVQEPQQNENDDVCIDLEKINLSKQKIKIDYTAERKFIAPYSLENE